MHCVSRHYAAAATVHLGRHVEVDVLNVDPVPQRYAIHHVIVAAVRSLWAPFKGVINLNAEITHRTFKFQMAEQQGSRMIVVGFSVSMTGLLELWNRQSAHA